MKFLGRFFPLIAILVAHQAISQDSTGLGGVAAANSDGAQYLFDDWYTGSARTTSDKVEDGLPIRYDVAKDELEYKAGSETYRVSEGIQEFNLPTGTDLYTFRSGYPAVGDYTEKTFYRLMYDGNTKLLKKYVKPIKTEKASATRQMEPSAKLFILKDGKMNPVQLNNRNSFLKLMSDERNKVNWVIREQQMDFAADDDLIRLMEEYDSYKAGRGGN